MEKENRHNPLTLIMAGMEACWLYTALLIMVQKTGSIGLSPVLLLSVYPVSLVFERVLRSLPWPWTGRTGASIAGWFVCILLLGRRLYSSTSALLDISWLPAFASGVINLPSFPSQEQLLFLSSALIWWLGRRLSGLPHRFSTFISEFQFGIAILLILFFVASQWEMNLPVLLLVCTAFFAFSFFGISLAHAAEGKSWLRGTHRNEWLSILSFVVCLVFALGLLMSALIKPELLKIMLSVPKLLWHIISELMHMIMAFIAGLFPKSDPVFMPPPGGAPVIPAEPPSWSKLLRIPDWVRRVGQIVVSSIWLVLILAALWSLCSQMIHWLRHKLDHDEGAHYEPISGAFREDLMHILRIILLRISRIIRFFRRRGEKHTFTSKEAESLRQIYRRLIDWAASAGCPRHEAQTPGEYLLTLTGWFPEGRLEFSLITEQFVLIRYSPAVPTRRALENVVKAWDRLERMKRPGRQKISRQV